MHGTEFLFDHPMPMLRNRLQAAGILFVVLLGSLLAAAQASPTIASLSVNSGVTGAAVTISGTNFGTIQGSSTVTFNGTAASVNSWSDSIVSVIVPTLATTGNVVVTVGGVASNGVKFTVIPNITGLLVNGTASDTAQVGATVTINGSGFGNTIGFSVATLEGVPLAGDGVRPNLWSDQSIVVVLPETVSSGNVVVRIRGVTSNAVPLIVTPVITGISPSSASAGAGVTILGNGFGTGIGTVAFNGVEGTVSAWTDSSIFVTVPNGATSGAVVVTVAGQSSNGFDFTVTP